MWCVGKETAVGTVWVGDGVRGRCGEERGEGGDAHGSEEAGGAGAWPGPGALPA